YVFGQRGLDDIITEMMEQQARQSAPPAATEEMINALSKVQINEEIIKQSADCSICQDSFSEGSSVIELPCHHIFHPVCIEHWLKTNGTCPMCRFSIVTNTPYSTT
ncbi:hypothetical protein HK096_008886, partial [Nowakowskiella sp. JEL0078]